MLLRPLASLGFLLLLAGCDSAGDGPLAPGDFRATVSGAVEGRYEGNALFSDTETPFDTVLSVRLKVGEYRAPGRTYTVATGIFLTLPWAREPGTYPVSPKQGSFAGTVALPSGRTFGFPAPYRVASGTVTITHASAERVEGTFDVVAEDMFEGDTPSLRAQGAFAALLGEE